MSARKCISVLVLLTVLLASTPLHVTANYTQDGFDAFYQYPPYQRAFTVQGDKAVFHRGAVYVIGEQAPEIIVYDCESGTEVGRIALDGTARYISNHRSITTVTDKGTIYVIRGEIDDLEVQTFSLVDGPEAMLPGPSDSYSVWTGEMVAGAYGNNVGVFDLKTGARSYQAELPAGSSVKWIQRDAKLGMVVQYLLNDQHYVVTLDYTGRTQYGPFPTSGTSPTLFDTGWSSGTLYFVAPDGVSIQQLLGGNVTTVGVTKDEITFLSNYGSTLVVHHGKNADRYSATTKTVLSEHVAGAGSNSLQFTMGTYFVGGPGYVAQIDNGNLVWAETLTDSDATAKLLDLVVPYFALQLKQGEIAVYRAVDKYLRMLSLRDGERHVYTFDHPADGTTGLGLNIPNVHPHLDLHYQVLLKPVGSDNWESVEQGKITGQALTYRSELPAGQLKLVVEARPDDPGIDLTRLPLTDPWSIKPLVYGLNVLTGLEGGLDTYLKAAFAGEKPIEVWNTGLPQQVEWEVRTKPGQIVRFAGIEQEVVADRDGRAKAMFTIGDGLLHKLQAFVTDGNGQEATVSVLVINHLLKASPEKEEEELSRFPAIPVTVPNAATIDLEASSLKVAGQKVPLYANLKTNTVYGVPTSSLPTGSLDTELVLIGKKEYFGGESKPLELVRWRLTITLSREAVLEPGYHSATVNQRHIKLDAPVYIHRPSSSTMVPFRFVGDVMGARVDWNSKSRQVTFLLDDKRVVLTIGSKTAYVNGQAVTMPTSPALVNSRTFIPLRFVSEQLGANVHWDGKARTITIKVSPVLDTGTGVIE